MQNSINSNRLAINETTKTLGIMFLLLLCIAGIAGAQTKTWTGEGKSQNWHDPKNWNPRKIPTQADDVVIPADAGKILVKGVAIKVKSLTIKKSKKKCGTILTSATEGGNLFFQAFGGDINIGKNNKIVAADGKTPVPIAKGQNGGAVRLQASGNIVNMGTVRGGKAGDGMCPGRGGDVDVNAGGAVLNTCGSIIGGEGGSFTGSSPGAPGAGAVSGNRGGNVRVRSKKGGKTGVIKGGKSGVGFSGTRRTTNYGGATWLSSNLEMQPSEKIRGKKITFESPAGIDLRNLQARAFVASEAIYLNAHGATIDLRGIAAGTLVFDTPDICFEGNVILDPGVSAATLCTGNVHFGLCADRPVEFVLYTESFVTTGSDVAPNGWAARTLVGNGFQFENTTNLPLPAFVGECGGAFVDSNQNGFNPDQAILETPLLTTDGIDKPILLEWDQWHQPSANSTVEVFVVQGGNATPVFFNDQGTPDNDHPVIDITNIVQPNDDFLVRFLYTANDQSWWILDNIEIRVLVDPLQGQAPEVGVALFDVNDSKNINGLPVYFQDEGPYFSEANTVNQAHLHFEGPANSIIFLFGGFVMPKSTIDPVFGQLDLDNPFLLDSGLNNGPFSAQFQLQANGQQDIFLPIAPTSAGTTLGLQAAFMDMQTGQVKVANAVQLEIVH